MEDIFYNSNEMWVFLSKRDMEDFKTQGNLSKKEKGKSIDLKFFEKDFSKLK